MAEKGCLEGWRWGAWLFILYDCGLEVVFLGGENRNVACCVLPNGCFDLSPGGRAGRGIIGERRNGLSKMFIFVGITLSFKILLRI